MAHFNKQATNPNATTNQAGGAAFSNPDEQALAEILLTSFFSGNGEAFYERDSARQNRLRELVQKVPPLFAAKAAIYARDQFGMRTSSHLVATELAKMSFPEKERFFEKIVVRPDDMLEITAAVLSKVNGGDGKLPAALKRGFAKALSNVDEYRLAKYRGEGKQVNMFDLVNLVHPRQTVAITKLMTGTLPVPETFETKLSATGKVAEDVEDKELAIAENKEKAWEELVVGGKIGYFALLRNLRNIWLQGNEATKAAALDLLTNPAMIKKSRVMPFRYMTAYSEICMGERGHAILDHQPLVRAIAKAFDIAFQSNVKPFSGNTLVVWDDSGSMDSTNGRSNVRNVTLAASFGFALAKLSPDSTHVGRFSHDASYVMFNSDVPTIDLAVRTDCPNGATNMHTVFELAKNKGQVYDRIFIISDMQTWAGGDSPARKSLLEYKKATGANPVVYSWDIAGHGNTQFIPNQDRVVALSGWMGDKVFDLIQQVEEGTVGGLVEKIKQVTL